MKLGMDKIGDFLDRRIQAFNAQYEPDCHRLEHPLGMGNVEVKPGEYEQNANRRLHHDAVFGSNEFECAVKSVPHALEPSLEKSIVLFEFHL